MFHDFFLLWEELSARSASFKEDAHFSIFILWRVDRVLNRDGSDKTSIHLLYASVHSVH